MPSPRTQEAAFNLALAEAFKRLKPEWRERRRICAEQTRVLERAARKPDVLFAHEKYLPLCIESSQNRNDAEADAVARIGQKVLINDGGKIRNAIALYWPPELHNLEREEMAARLHAGFDVELVQYKLHRGEKAPRRFPEEGWQQLTLAELAHLIPYLATDNEKADFLREEAVAAVRAAADRLSAGIARKNLPPIEEKIQLGSPLETMQSAWVIFLNALKTQNDIFEGDNSIDIPPVPSPDKYFSTDDILAAWQLAIQHNWQAILEPARELLLLVSSASHYQTKRGLETMCRLCRELFAAKIGTQVQISAEIYPVLAPDRKTAAAYYTQPTTSTLMAELALTENTLPGINFGSTKALEEMRILDPACGTGTLLRAAYHRVRELHEQQGGNEKSLRQLHNIMMEKGLVGLDVSPIAAHMAATAAAACQPGVPYQGSQIGWVSVRRGRTGSGQLLKAEHVSNELPGMGADESIRASTGGGQKQSIRVPNGAMDLIIMNPPYSRSRRGQSLFDINGLSAAGRRQCQNELKGIVKQYAPNANIQGGMATVFLALADKKIKPGGVLASVLPATAAHAGSYENTRLQLVRQYEDITVISNSESCHEKDKSMSADTGLKEIVLIAKKKRDGAADVRKQIASVNFKHPPATQGEAVAYAAAIRQAMARARAEGGHQQLFVGDSKLGDLALETAEGGNPWIAVGTGNPELSQALFALAMRGEIKLPKGEVARIPITTPERMKSDAPFTLVFGPTHDLLGTPRKTYRGDGSDRGAFIVTEIQSRSDATRNNTFLWYSSHESQRCTEVAPTSYGHPQPFKPEEKIHKLQEQMTHHFLQRMPRYTAQALLTAYTEKLGHGGRAWAGINVTLPEGARAEKMLKAYALWFQSMFGIMCHYAITVKSDTGRGQTQIKQLNASLPIPDLSRAPARRITAAAQRFDALKNLPLKRMNQAHQDENRGLFNQAVIALLGLPKAAEAALDSLTAQWCNEPHVSGRNR